MVGRPARDGDQGSMTACRLVPTRGPRTGGFSRRGNHGWCGAHSVFTHLRPGFHPLEGHAAHLFNTPSHHGRWAFSRHAPGAYARAHELVACVPAQGWRGPRRTGRAGPGKGAPTAADGYVPQPWAHVCEPSRGASTPPGASLRNHRRSRHHRHTKNLRHRNGHRDGRPRRTRSGGSGGRPTRSRGRHRPRPPTNSPRRHCCCGGTPSCSRRTCRPSGSPYGSRGARPRPRP